MRRLSAAEISLRGNSRHLTPAQLKAREAEEARSETPADYVPAGKPRMPGSVRAIPEAAEAWKSAAKILKERGALTRGDAPALTVYSLCTARYLKAVADVQERGFEVEVTRIDKKGETYTTSTPNPSLQIVAQCERQLLALAVRLGMTPKDRSAIRPAKRKKPANERFVPIPGTAGALLPEYFDKFGKLKVIRRDDDDSSE